MKTRILILIAIIVTLLSCKKEELGLIDNSSNVETSTKNFTTVKGKYELVCMIYELESSDQGIHIKDTLYDVDSDILEVLGESSPVKFKSTISTIPNKGFTIEFDDIVKLHGTIVAKEGQDYSFGEEFEYFSNVRISRAYVNCDIMRKGIVIKYSVKDSQGTNAERIYKIYKHIE